MSTKKERVVFEIGQRVLKRNVRERESSERNGRERREKDDKCGIESRNARLARVNVTQVAVSYIHFLSFSFTQFPLFLLLSIFSLSISISYIRESQSLSRVTFCVQDLSGQNGILFYCPLFLSLPLFSVCTFFCFFMLQSSSMH